MSEKIYWDTIIENAAITNDCDDKDDDDDADADGDESDRNFNKEQTAPVVPLEVLMLAV